MSEPSSGSTDSRPNVLFVVLDSFRFDALAESPFLSRLREDNVSFENAITPASWTYPSHMSLFHGSYPHEHRKWMPESPVGPLPLAERFADVGYTTYGFSSNVYFSTGYGVDESFDQFVDTYRPLLASGYDPYSYVREGKSGDGGFVSGVASALGAVRSPADAANFGLATLDKVIERLPARGSRSIKDHWTFFKHGHRSSKRLALRTRGVFRR